MAKVIVKSGDQQNKQNVLVINRSRQMIPLQIRPPGGDFFYEEHQIRLMPGKSAVVPREFLNSAQIDNCKAKGVISVVEDAEAE